MMILKCALVLVSLFAFSAPVYSSLDSRVDSAYQRCLRPNMSSLKVRIKPAPGFMEEHYKPNLAQRMSSGLHRAIFDEFGHVVQGMLTKNDVPYVRPYLRSLGRKLGQKVAAEGLTTQQATCLASCITNELLESDESIFPTTSMDLAVAKGSGFCRHFVYTMEYIMKAAGVPSKKGHSWDHIFFYSNIDGEDHIFDPSNYDGVSSCTYHPKVK